jgi:sugar lactone lactonase YvrE
MAGGVIAIDPKTKVVTTIASSYFGLRFNFPDDVVWVRRGGKAYMFFTDLEECPPSPFLATADNPVQLPNAVWCLNPQEKALRPVISRTEIAISNGIRVNAEGTKSYVTDSSYPGKTGLAALGWANTAIHEYDFDDNMVPSNHRLFSISSLGVPDGIKVDEYRT